MTSPERPTQDLQYSIVNEVVVEPNTNTGSTASRRKGLQFWMVLFALHVAFFLAVMESYAVSTALPTIVADLQGSQFIWVGTAYGIASSALLPLAGGLAEIFGRRVITLVSIGLFALGGALGGAAQSMNMLIAARVIQGAGAGGILTLSQIILSDMVTLEERGLYNGLYGLTWALGGGVGPAIGGALAHHTRWRWLFYLNVPSSGFAAILVLAFLRLPKPQGTWREKTSRIDWIGNLILIGATTSCVIGLTWGGTVFKWTSARVLAPLVIGVFGLAFFVVYEWNWCKNPFVPKILLGNRTSISGYAQITLSAFINICFLYFLPVYYQACKDASPTASGIDLFALSFSTAPFSIITGVSIQISKRYRPQIWFSWCITLIGLGLLSTVTKDTSRATSIGYQILNGVGIGIMYSAAYFPVLAPLPVSSNAYAVSFFIFLRTFAQVWGVTIGGAILQNELQNRLPASLDATIAPGVSVAYAIIPLIPSLPSPVKDLARQAFASSLVTLWRVLIAIAGVGLLVSLPMKGLRLHTETDAKWGLEERKRPIDVDDQKSPEA